MYCRVHATAGRAGVENDVENWDEVAFACGLCVADAKAKPASVLRLLQPGLPPHVPGSATGRAGRGEQGRGRVCLRALRDGRHGQIANTTQGARLMREMRQRRRPPRPGRDARLATTTYGTSMTRSRGSWSSALAARRQALQHHHQRHGRCWRCDHLCRLAPRALSH